MVEFDSSKFELDVVLDYFVYLKAGNKAFTC